MYGSERFHYVCLVQVAQTRSCASCVTIQWMSSFLHVVMKLCVENVPPRLNVALSARYNVHMYKMYMCMCINMYTIHVCIVHVYMYIHVHVHALVKPCLHIFSYYKSACHGFFFKTSVCDLMILSDSVCCCLQISVDGVYSAVCVNCRQREAKFRQNCGHMMCHS